MIYVFEDQYALNLEPLTLTWATFELRCGAYTHLERIRRVVSDKPLSLVVRPEMAAVVQERYPDLPVNPEQVVAGLWLNGTALWDEESFQLLDAKHAHMMQEERLVGGYLPAYDGRAFRDSLMRGEQHSFNPTEYEGPTLLHYLWDHFLTNGERLTADFDRWYRSAARSALPRGVEVVGDGGVYLGKDVTIDPAVTLDIRHGPVIIEDGTTIASHSVIAGPTYLGSKCKVWPFAFLEEVALGPVCRVMGQVEGTIMQGYTNKQHDGFLGHAYLGSWINLGAGTTNSDLKNNYGPVKVLVNGQTVDTGKTFIGMFMGDHAKTAIGTLFNTGTRVGVAANVFGPVTPPKVVPSFAWGGDGQERYDLEKCLETMATVKGRRGQELTQAERDLFKRLYEEAQ
ncbi:MAG: putative sugar nucleotidyl transferase [Candidatus Neomarinimicrobiota bacterium]